MRKIILISLLVICSAVAIYFAIQLFGQLAEQNAYEEIYQGIIGESIMDADPDDSEEYGEYAMPDSGPDDRHGTEPTSTTAKPKTAPKAAPERVNVDFEKLRKTNPDAVGWLYIKGTKINYPVVQARNNDYYLDHSFKREPAACGALFMDYENKPHPLDRNTVIYGHNMGSSSSLMFSKLLAYKKKSFFQEHPVIQFDTLEMRGSWQVFAVCHLNIASLNDFNFLRQDFGSDSSFESFVQKIQTKSLYDTHVNVSSDTKIVTFITCDRSKYAENGRLAVYAVLK